MHRARLRYYKLSSLFKIYRGSSKYIKSYYRDHPGPFPVYSASADPAQVHGMVDGFDFEGRYLTWTTNGYAGYAFLREGKFCATRDVGVLKPHTELSDRINLEFFAPVLTKVLREAATGRRKESGESDYTKIAASSAASVQVPVPVDCDGLPLLSFQEEIAERYGSLASLRARLSGILAEISKKHIAFAGYQGQTREFKVSDLFEVSKGDGSITRKYILSHQGEYPVYTGSSFRNEVAGHIASFDFEGEYLTWAADGYAGPVFARSGRFSANSHAGILKPREKYAEKLHLPYFEYALTPILESMAVGRFRADGAPDYTRVTVGMVREAFVTLPVDDHGLPDPAAQEKVTAHIEPLERDKRAVEDELRRLIKAEPVVDWMEPLEDWVGAGIE